MSDVQDVRMKLDRRLTIPITGVPHSYQWLWCRVVSVSQHFDLASTVMGSLSDHPAVLSETKVRLDPLPLEAD